MASDSVPMAGPSTGGEDVAIASAAIPVVELITKDPIVRTASVKSVRDDTNIGRPTEQLEIDEGGPAAEEIVYPTGPKLWLTMISLCIVMFLQGLDIAIVAVAVPGLTDDFKTIADIGWYSAAYGLVMACFMFFFGKAYQLFHTKRLYMFGLVVFETGSLLCTLAPNSKAFILGRAIAGFGSSAYGGSAMKLVKDCFPLHKQALIFALVGGSQAVGLVSAPLFGGLLIQGFTWRGCFGVNLPLGVMCIAFTAWGFHEQTILPEFSLPFREKVKRLDLFSTVLIIPATACLLMALQWGGIKYGWSDPRIIVLFVVFAITFSGFAYLQYRLGDAACVPPRILKQRSVLGAMWFSACCNGILAVTEYYISIYFQGVRGFTPLKAGLLGIPLLAGCTCTGLLTSAIINKIGHYSPFLYMTSILAPIASGLLTTVSLDGSIVKPAAFLGFLGAALGFGIIVPSMAISRTLSSKDITIGGAIQGFGAGLGSATFICVSATLFQARLGPEIQKHSPSSNATLIDNVGLSDIRRVIGPDSLRDVLSGYNEAVVQTLYLPLALCVLTLVGTVTIERKSMKVKSS